MLCTCIGSKRILKFSYLGAHDVLAVVEHALNACIDVSLKCLVLRLKINKFHDRLYRGVVHAA